MSELFDVTTPRRVHVVGVGGPGMSAIAQVLAQMGNVVSGSDVRESVVIERIRALGVAVNIGHEPQVVHGCDAVTASSAIPQSNSELREAAMLEITTLTRAQILAAICATKETIAVAGTHGKTTTSSMLMTVMSGAGLSPSFIIGGDIRELGTGAAWNSGKHLIVEADESDGTHEQLPVSATILTNIDLDHLDHFQSFARLQESFSRYLSSVRGTKVVCVSDEHIAAMVKTLQSLAGLTTYGIDCDADVVGSNLHFAHGGSRFTVTIDGDVLGEVSLQLRGRHNVLNALGVIAMSWRLGISFTQIQESLADFGGVVRRFDLRGMEGGVTFVDDYAHLPNEIAAVLGSCRDSTDAWKRIVAVFQPNRFNRMSVMSDAYAGCFTDADVVVVTDIYSSGTAPIEGVTGKLVVDAVVASHPSTQIEWKQSRTELVEYLANELVSGDLCISMGCGDIQSLPDEVIDRRSQIRGVQ
jgi:UDP-N-acetylmuramate--alanine ligase